MSSMPPTDRVYDKAEIIEDHTHRSLVSCLYLGVEKFVCHKEVCL